MKRATKGIVDVIELGVTGSHILREGNLAFVTVSGHALSASTNGPTGARFVGVVLDDADNSTGAASAVSAQIATGPGLIVKLSSSAEITNASIGLPVFVASDNAIALSGTSTNGLHQVGTVHKAASTTEVWVVLSRNLGNANLTP